MKLPTNPTIGSGPTSGLSCVCNRAGQAAFTFAEVLAALLFMAVVIPVTMQGLQIANRAGVVAERKSEAVRVADQLLSEFVVTGNWRTSGQRGVYGENRLFQWRLLNEPWLESPLRRVSIEVTYQVQNQPYEVLLSTLVKDTTQ